MNRAEYDLFLTGAMWIAAVMAVVMVFRWKSRGASAYVMAVAYLVFGLLAYLLKTSAPQGWLIAVGVVLAALLLLDLALRAGPGAKKDRPR